MSVPNEQVATEQVKPLAAGHGNGQGPKYFLDIEGREVPWDRDTITTEEIITLGGWDPSQGAILIDKDNNERTLQPGEVVELKPGMGFSKKVKFKRG
jgi:hypothetical protein